MRKKVLIKGPILSRSGYGEQARFAFRSLRKNEDKFDIFVVNTQWGQTGWLAENDEERRYIDFLIEKTYHHVQDKQGFDMSVQVTIPNEWEKITPMDIGYTAGIETNKVAPEWIQKSRLVDKIIVTSNHSKNVFLDTTYDLMNKDTKQKVSSIKCETPIETVGYPVREHEKENLDLELETDFNFLVVSQWGPRKNIGSTIQWFVENFKDNENVGLIVKGFFKNNCNMDREGSTNALKGLVPDNAKCKVYLLHGDLTDGQMTSLYTNKKIKGLISISHGEGYGLPLFEAAYSGLPVITTNWSGHCDFLNMPEKQRKKGSKKKTQTVMKPMFAEVDYTLGQIQPEAVWNGVLQADSMWCYADKESYQKVLTDFVKNHAEYKKKATKLKKWVRSEFDSEKQHSSFAKAVAPETEDISVESMLVSFD